MFDRRKEVSKVRKEVEQGIYGVNGTGKRTSLSHIPDMTTVAISLQNIYDVSNSDIFCDLKSSSL